jgi:hypothetical protein
MPTDIFNTVRAPYGSVSAPSIHFGDLSAGDTGTGLYRVAANEIGVAVSGVLHTHFKAQYLIRQTSDNSCVIQGDTMSGGVSSNPTHCTTLSFRRSRGTLGALTATVADDLLGYFSAAGYASGAYDSACAIAFQQDGAVSGGNVPGKIIFQTATNAGSLGPALTIFNDKKVQIHASLAHIGTLAGFFNATPITKPSVTSARNNPEGALKNLIVALDSLGLILNNTTAS